MINDFTQLIKWSKSEHAELPWRNGRSLYTTLVSEIMLQQTTVSTVKPKFSSFIKLFPTLESLAQCKEDDLALAWQGLGYYRRAANLFKAAKYLHIELGGEFPQDANHLMEIPGIGHYTAHALLAIGMDKATLALDANLKRVLARYFALKLEGKELETALMNRIPLFAEVFEEFSGRQVNEAFMDLGRVTCTARAANCLICPLYKTCEAAKLGDPMTYPLKKDKPKPKEELSLMRFLIIEDGEVLVYQKEQGEWLNKQWELPTAVISCTEKIFKQYPIGDDLKTPDQKPIKTSITKYKISNYSQEISREELHSSAPQYTKRKCKFVSLEELQNSQSKVHLSSASLKVLRSL